MVTLRYRKLGPRRYSAYLDIYINNAPGGASRNFETLNIYVSKDYSKAKRILAEDKEKVELASNIRSVRELELSGAAPTMVKNKRVNRSMLKYILSDYEKNGDERSRRLHKYLLGYSKGKDILFSNFKEKDITNFKVYLLQNVSHNTMLDYLFMLMKFVNNAYQEGIISSNPFFKYKIPKKHETDRAYLELHEIQKLSDTDIEYEGQIKEAFLFSCFTGLRLSDLRTLKYSQIIEELDKDGARLASLQVYPKKTENTSGQLLKAPLSSQALKILKNIERGERGGLVFDLLPAKSTISKYLKKWGEAAGINKNMHMHVARHTFATLALTSGIDIYTVSKLMGHSRINATQTYAQIIEEKKQREVKKFPSFNFNRE